MQFAAKKGLDEALRLIDRRDNDPAWGEAFVRWISENHFGDGETCIITDPDAFQELRVDAYRFSDGSGFAVDHDLAMNYQRSDFTAQFEFRRPRMVMPSTSPTFMSSDFAIPCCQGLTAAANRAIAVRLQSTRPVGRFAQPTSLAT